MTETQRDDISLPATGLLIYQTDETPGYYYYSGTNWIGITGSGPGAISTPSLLIDCDGNNYPAITIGDQVWMAENLRVTHYKNGDAIPNVTDNIIWSTILSGVYCWYNNDQSANEKYGPLYNWYAVEDYRGLCPDGWHVPTEAEWTTLITYLGGTTEAGGKMKATSDLWDSPNYATNISKFSGLPGGYRSDNGTSYAIGSTGYFWSSTIFSSTQAKSCYLQAASQYGSLDNLDKRRGFSVRCIRD